MTTPFHEKAKDWVIVFWGQVTDDEMSRLYDRGDVDFVLWTRRRLDGNTIAWVRSVFDVSRRDIEKSCIDGRTVGSLQAQSDWKDWFRSMTTAMDYRHNTYGYVAPSGLEPAMPYQSTISTPRGRALYPQDDYSEQQFSSCPIGVLSREYTFIR